MLLKRLLLLLWLLALQPAVADNVIGIGEFSRNGLDGWEPHRFKGDTLYRLQIAEGRTVLHAESRAAACILIPVMVSYRGIEAGAACVRP